ncbi:hypothetical protein BJY04DRAFT_223049 [Aspergillus karnatakaensis]|uniref:uncharacterized protein n=1 Tax=Aspergillus karnatakaensis TaxID=1810916 RepID=UPI003CCCD8DD
MNSTSIDGNCGSNSDVEASCMDSEWGNCCSLKGYCGKTKAYCGEGCQSAFGECDETEDDDDDSPSSTTTSTSSKPTVSSSANNTSIDGNCGSNSDIDATCLGSQFGDCCSAKGYCGKTDVYCGEGCQLDFGSCNDASKQTISKTGSCGATLTSNVTCAGSTYGDCCSANGFCGEDSTYCGTGCQSEFGICGLNSITSISSSTSTSTSSSTSTSDPSASATIAPSQISDSSNDGLSKGAIAGISVGASVAGCALIALLVWLLIFRKRTPDREEDTLIETFKPPIPMQEMGVDVKRVHEMDGNNTRGAVELPASQSH